MATGDTLLVFTESAVTLPATNYAGLAVENYRPIITFDAGSPDETVYFTSIMPRHYDRGGVRVYITYAMESAVAGKVEWEIDFESCESGTTELASDNFTGSPVISNPTVPNQADTEQTIFSNFAPSQMDGINGDATTNFFRLKITRDANSADDTAAGDAHLLRVEIRER